MWFVIKRTLEGTSEIPGQVIVTTISSKLVVIQHLNIEEEWRSPNLQILLLEIKIIEIDYKMFLTSL